MDRIGWFIATMHSIVGHDATARFIGESPGDRAACVICAYDRNPTVENRQAVELALAAPEGRPDEEQR